jgi:hypothetical protein
MAGFQPLGSVSIDPSTLASFTGINEVSGIYLDVDPSYSSVLLQTNSTNAIYVDTYQNVGINTTSPDSQLVINSASGNCLQMRYNNSSSYKSNMDMTSDGKLTFDASGGEITILSTSNLNILAHNGTTTGLILNNTLVLATAVQLNYNTVTPGTASNSKALVLNSVGSIAGINSISATSVTGTLQTASQPNITSVGTLTGLSITSGGSLTIGSTVFAENDLSPIQGVTHGTAAASKALILDANKDISGILNLSATNLTGTLQTASQPNVTSLGTLTGLDMNGYITGLSQLSINTTVVGRTLVLNDSNGNCLQLTYNNTSGSATTYVDILVNSGGNLLITPSGNNVDITTHNGSTQGLKLGGVLVQSTSNELNYIHGSTPGTIVAGKAVVVDSSRNIGNLNNLTAVQLTGTLQTASQPNVTSVNVLDVVNHDGANQGLSLGGTLVLATATELNKIHSITAGTASAGKVLITDASNNISSINELSASTIYGTIATASQPNINSVDILDIVDHDGTTQGLSLGGVLVTATAAQINSIFSGGGGGGGGSFGSLTISGNLTLSGANGSNVGLILGSTLVTASGTELNYLDGTVLGVANSNTVMSTDNNNNIGNINELSANSLAANYIYGPIQTASQPSITSVGTLTSLNVSGTTTTNDLVTTGSVNKSLLSNWTYQSSVPSNNWSSIAYSPSLKVFLAVANNTSGTVLIRSTDGITWTNLSSPSSGNAFIDILWIEDAKVFVTFTYTAGNSNISICVSSNSGTSWTLIGLGIGSRITDIDYIKETALFVCTGRDTSLTNNQIYWIPNSNSVYTAGNMSYTNTTTSMSINKLVYSVLWGYYYALEWNSTGSTTVRIEYSANITWSGATVTTISGLPRAKIFRCLCEGFEIGTMIAVATDTGGSTGSILYTTNGTSWAQATASSSASWFKAVWVPELGIFVVISSDSSPSMMTSKDGINWTSVTLPGSWTTLADIKWFPEIGTLSLVSSVAGSTYNINHSYFTSFTNMNYLTNPNYTSVVTNMNAGPMLNINTGLNGGCRWLTTNNSNISNEVMRLGNTGLSINANQTSTAALDIMTSLVKNNNKVLRLKTNRFGWNYDYTFSSANQNAVTLVTSFSGGGNNGNTFTNMSLSMNHCLAVTGAVSSTSTTTGTLIVTGGVGVSGNLNIGGGLTTGTSGYTNNVGDQFYHISETTGPYGGTGTSPAYFTKQAIWSPQLQLFVVTTGGTNVMYSSNGNVWSSTTSSARTWEGITWADGLGLFVAVANDSSATTGQIMTSSNGTSWTARNGPASNNGGNWNSVCWSPQLQLLVACSSVGTTNSYGLMRSSDGITWTIINHPNTTNASTSFTQVIWNSYLNQFVACGNGQFAVSSNGITWSIYNTSTATGQFQCVAYSPVLGSYYASASSTTTACAVSTNGITWTTTSFAQTSNRMLWIPNLNAFITTSNTGYDAWTRNGTSYNSLTRAYGNSSNFDICYAPDLDVMIMTMPSTNTSNQNIAISAALSVSKINLAYNTSMSKTNQLSLTVDSNVNLTSGYNSGHRFYNASTLTGSKNNMLATIMPIIGSGTITTPSFGLGVATPAAQIDIQTSIAGEFQRIRSPFSIGSLKYLSLGIDSNYGLTLTSSTASNATSTTSGGTLTVTGGAAISKALYVGSTVTASLPGSGSGFSHTAGSQTLSTYYDATSNNIGLGTTTNNNLNFFTNNRYGTTAALSLIASNNYVSVNTTLTGTAGTFANAINVNSYIQATQDYSVWVSGKGNTVYAPIIAAINNAGGNPWIGTQHALFNMPTAIGYGALTGPIGIIQSGYITPTYTETYTFTITYAYLFYKVWVNGVLVANNQSINTTSSTASFTVACTAGVPMSLYVQLIGKNSGAGSCNFSMVYASTSQTSTAPTWNSSDGCFNYIKTQPMSCPTLFTVYDMTAASTSLMKAEVLCNTSGNMVLKSSGLTTTVDSSNSLNIAGHNGSTLGLQLNGTLVTATATQLNYTNVTAGTAAASKALVLDSSSNITAINDLTSTGILTTTNSTDSSSISTGSIITAGGVGITKKLYVGDGIYGTLQSSSQTNITSVGTLTGLTSSGAVSITDTTGSTSISTGSLITAGGVGIGENLYVNGIAYISSSTDSSSSSTGSVIIVGGVGIAKNLYVGGVTRVLSTTDASSSSTGSITTLGGVGIAKTLYVGTGIYGTLQTASQPNISSVDVLDIVNHNASTIGLKLGGTLITASATEINYVDTTPGSAAASKALVLDSSSNITGINNLSATSLTGTLQTSSQPNITSVGTLSGVTIGSGNSLTIGSTSATESDIAKITGITNGTAAAGKALVLDSNKDIASINKISTALINIASASNSTLPLEVGVVSYAYTGGGAYMNSTNSLGVITANPSASSANYSLRCDGRILIQGELQISSDRRIKKNINKLSLDLAKEFIMTSNPVKFNWITDDNQTDYGFIAQEVAANPNFKDLVNIVPHEGLEAGIDETTGVLNPADHKYVLAPGKIIPLLVLTNKDLYKQLEEKDKKIEDLEDRLSRLETIISLLNL